MTAQQSRDEHGTVDDLRLQMYLQITLPLPESFRAQSQVLCCRQTHCKSVVTSLITVVVLRQGTLELKTHLNIILLRLCI